MDCQDQIKLTSSQFLKLLGKGYPGGMRQRRCRDPDSVKVAPYHYLTGTGDTKPAKARLPKPPAVTVALAVRSELHSEGACFAPRLDRRRHRPLSDCTDYLIQKRSMAGHEGGTSRQHDIGELTKPGGVAAVTAGS